MKEAIQLVIKEMMDRVMNNVLVSDPFMKEAHKANKPLYAALVPDEIFKGSHFERRFVTPFGGAWEKLAIVTANKGLGFGEKTRTITGNVNAERLRRIQEVLNNLEHGEKGGKRIKPDWDTELNYILEGKSDELIPVIVISDVYAENKKTGEKYGGLVCEYGGSNSEKDARESLEKSLHELYYTGFSEDFTLEHTRFISESFIPQKKYGTALVALCFASHVCPIIR